MRDQINALEGDAGESDAEAADEPGLFEQIRAASIQDRIALAAEARRVMTLGRDESLEPD